MLPELSCLRLRWHWPAGFVSRLTQPAQARLCLRWATLPRNPHPPHCPHLLPVPQPRSQQPLPTPPAAATSGLRVARGAAPAEVCVQGTAQGPHLSSHTPPLAPPLAPGAPLLRTGDAAQSGQARGSRRLQPPLQ